jgi:U3 small nucleolar RNA-associated protein 7
MKRPRPESQQKNRSSKSPAPNKRSQSRPALDLSSDPTIQKYAHGPVKFKASRQAPKQLRATLQDTRDSILESAKAAGDAEILLPAESGFIEMEHGVKTYKLTQRELVHNVDMNTARNILNLSLTNFGPYNVNYSRNGRSNTVFCSALTLPLGICCCRERKVMSLRWIATQ